MRFLVTGGTGFVGSNLSRALVAGGHQVVAHTSRGGRARARVPLAQGVTVHTADFRRRADIEGLVRRARPDVVVHLAALNDPQASWRSPSPFFRVNVEATMHLLEAAARATRDVRFLLVATSAQYGPVPPSRRPIREDEPFAPLTPYAVSKAAQELAARALAPRVGAKLVVARLFNTVGPGKRGDFVAHVGERIARAEAAGRSSVEIPVGRLAGRRDILHIDDAVKALVTLAERAPDGAITNVCTGRSVVMERVAESLAAAARVDVRFAVDGRRVRGRDEAEIVGSTRRLRRLVGWVPPHRPFDAATDALAWFRSIYLPGKGLRR